MTRAIIIDDEQPAIELLGTLLRDFISDVEVIGSADTVQSGIALIREKDPDLVFLDIQMPQGGGFAVLRSFEEMPCPVIFTTAYEEYAIKAIQYAALDYVLKPITVDRLQEAIARYRKAQERQAKQEGNIFLLPENLLNLHQQSTRIVLPIPKGMKILSISDIAFLKAAGVYAEVVTADGTKIVVSKGLKHFEELLGPYGILRVHDSYMVNVQHIDRYMRGRGGEVFLKDGTRIEVSRSRKDDLLKLLRGR